MPTANHAPDAATPVGLDVDAQCLVRLTDYSRPAMPTDESVRRLRDRVRDWLMPEEDEDPFISDDSLASVSSRRLDQLVSPPACGGLIRDMSLTFGDWIDDPHPSRRVQFVVMPPCDHHNVVRGWAVQRNYHLIQPPQRSRLIDVSGNDNDWFPVLDGPIGNGQANGRVNGQGTEHVDDSKDDAGKDSSRESGNHSQTALIVIPRLERWMLRHQNGLRHIRRLLIEVQQSPHRFVIGCSSWAWTFLSCILEGGHWLRSGLTLAPYRADRLAHWLHQLAQDELDAAGQMPTRFRLAATGEDVFARSGDLLTSDYFATLAAQSGGIPWVAWELWRRAIRLGPDADCPEDQKFPDEQTVWITPIAKIPSPVEFDAGMLMVLHTLLLHDGLTAEEIRLTSPSLAVTGGLSTLVAADWVSMSGGRYQCRAAAYPQIRSKLSTAGYSVPAI